MTTVADNRSPAEIIRDLLVERFPEAPTPELKSCRAYYGRFAIRGVDGTISVAYYPPEMNYVLDFGFESLVVFCDLFKAVGNGDPTFPHWNDGEFYCASKEEAHDILFAFCPRMLIVGTTGVTEIAELQARIASSGCRVISKYGDDRFDVIAPAFQENVTAAKVRKIPGIRYVVRNLRIRTIADPGWILDRVF